MFDRVLLKERAKVAIKSNYWMCVLIAFLLSLLATTATSSATKNDADFSISQTIQNLINQYGVNVVAIAASIVGAISLIGVIISILCNVFVKNPYEVGLKYFFVRNEEGQASFKDAFTTFKDDYLNVCKVIFMKNLMVGLWSLLLVIPGIIKALEYSQVEFIVSDDHSIYWKDALAMSSDMTYGKKMDIFMLDLSFIGWDILCAIPLVQLLWVGPYKRQTDAELYLALKYREM